MRQQSNSLLMTGLAWFLVGIGTLGTLFWVAGIFFSYSSDGDMTQEEIISASVGSALCTLLLFVLPGIAILLRQRRENGR